MRIFLSCDYYPLIDNLGSQALTEGLIINLNKRKNLDILRRGFISDYFRSFKSKFKLIPHKLLSNLLKKRLPYECAEQIFEIAFNLFTKFPELKGRIRDLITSDWIVVSGDGIMADIFEKSAFDALLDVYFAKKLNIPTIIVNHSVNFSDNVFFEFYKKMSFSAHLKAVVVREKRSLERLKEYGFQNEKLYLRYDCAFLVNSLSKSAGESALKIRGINTKQKLAGIVIRANRPTTQKLNLVSYKNLINFLKASGFSPLFLTSCPYHDYKVGIKLAKDLNLTLLSDYNYCYAEYIAILKNMDIVVSDRYHTVVFCFLANTPFVAFKGNTDKIEGLLTDSSFSEVFDYNNSDIAPVIRYIEQLMKKVSLTRKTLKKDLEFFKKNTDITEFLNEQLYI